MNAPCDKPFADGMIAYATRSLPTNECLSAKPSETKTPTILSVPEHLGTTKKVGSPFI